MKRHPRGLGVLAALVAVSCASGNTGDETTARAPGAFEPITRGEIDRGQWRDALELVRTIRPTWARSRGTDSFENPGTVQVYVDGTRLGNVELLSTLPTQGIQSVEWVDPVSAAGRWGLNHAHGVIYITYGRESALDTLPSPPRPTSGGCGA